MQSKDLRIGNYVKINNPLHRKKDSGKTFYILKIDSDGELCSGVCVDDMPYAECFGQFLKYINPIQITEEWLLQLGFYKNIDTGLFEKSGYQIDLTVLKCHFYLPDFGDWYKEIEFIHELQNLYFALTGEELELKHESKP